MSLKYKDYIKKGQGNQCQTPGVKFEEQTGRNGETRRKKKKQKKMEIKTPKTGRNWMILKETG